MGKPQATAQEWIMQSIASGELKPGDHIAHLALAQKLGVSNNPVIQVIRRLEEQGVLDRAPDGESRVRSYSYEEIYGILSVREAIESAAARFCAQKASDGEMALIRFRFDKMIRAYQGGAYVPEEELGFYAGIVQYSHTPILRRM